MFRALILFPNSSSSNTNIAKVQMEAPLSVTLVETGDKPPVELDIRPDAVFTTAVGHSSKRTLASWHVTTPQEIVEHMLEMIDFESGTVTPASPTEEATADKSHL